MSLTPEGLACLLGHPEVQRQLGRATQRALRRHLRRPPSVRPPPLPPSERCTTAQLAERLGVSVWDLRVWWRRYPELLHCAHYSAAGGGYTWEVERVRLVLRALGVGTC